MAGPDFVYLNGQAVRATSWRVAPDGIRSLVVIARGSADRDQLLDLLSTRPLLLTVPDEEPIEVVARDIDVRSTGTGQQAIHRIATWLVVADDPNMPAPEMTEPEPSVADRLAAIERKLDAVIALLENPHTFRER